MNFKVNMDSVAALLHGREYGKEISEGEANRLASSNLVVVFGYSDDNMEFRGAIYDEVSCWEGGDAFVYQARGGEWQVSNTKPIGVSHKVTAVWATDGYSWIYETIIPHTQFTIMEDGELYCRGIVFSLDRLHQRNRSPEQLVAEYIVQDVEREYPAIVLASAHEILDREGV